jgi:precorrin-3B synthase
MSGAPRGWCPTLFEPMASGDGLLARVKPPLGRLNAAGARALANAARRWGNGQFELTNRGALQARGFSQASLPAFRDAVLAAGLASPDPAVERRRNVLLSPFATSGAVALAADLERWIAQDEALAALPPKFGFAIEAPDRDPQPLPGDIRMASGTAGWRIALGGGEPAGVTADPLAAAQAIAHLFMRLAAGFEDPPRRTADLVARCGHAAFFVEAGVSPCDAPPARAATVPAVAGPMGGAFALGLAFGSVCADDLDCAADLAGRFGDGGLRLSPWRALILAGVPEAATFALAAAGRAAGFVVDRGDPRLLVVACPGAPACANAQATTRRDAGVVADRNLESLVHLSGCAKGCAHPAPAPIVLVATPEGYGLVRNGRAGDPPERRGLTLEQALAQFAAESPGIP